MSREMYGISPMGMLWNVKIEDGELYFSRDEDFPRLATSDIFKFHDNNQPLVTQDGEIHIDSDCKISNSNGTRYHKAVKLLNDKLLLLSEDNKIFISSNLETPLEVRNHFKEEEAEREVTDLIDVYGTKIACVDDIWYTAFLFCGKLKLSTLVGNMTGRMISFRNSIFRTTTGFYRLSFVSGIMGGSNLRAELLDVLDNCIDMLGIITSHNSKKKETLYALTSNRKLFESNEPYETWSSREVPDDDWINIYSFDQLLHLANSKGELYKLKNTESIRVDYPVELFQKPTHSE